jgi:hypothetical protein
VTTINPCAKQRNPFPTAACFWCGNDFVPGGRGRPQKFCSSGCRSAFFAAARSWAVGEALAGRLPIERLRNAAGKTCTFPGRENDDREVAKAEREALAASWPTDA